MLREPASETEAVTTPTIDRWNNGVELSRPYRTIDRIFAIWCWTPSEVGLIIHIGPIQQFLIPDILSEHVLNKRGIRETVTHLLSISAGTSKSTVLESTILEQPSDGHCIRVASPSSFIFDSKYCR